MEVNKMKIKWILVIGAILIVLWPKTTSTPRIDLPPYWRISTDYQDVIIGLRENGFTDQIIDSMFYAADSGRIEYLKERAEKERYRQIFKFIILKHCPYIPKNTLNSILRRLLGEWEDIELLSQESINLGKEVLRNHQQLLSEIEKKEKVEKEIIVAIYRIETCCGKNLGQYHVFTIFDSIIVSPANTKPSKIMKERIKKEIVALFIICRNNRLDLRQMMGSRSGAIGLTQFMPTSYLKFAIDGNNDGIINLFDWSDASISTARYLKLAGWHKKKSLKMNKMALYSYNHDWYYVKNVIKYARKIGFKK